MEFPALFHGADTASNSSQATYLRLIKLEYGVLFLASILALSFSRAPLYFAAYAGLFIASIILLLFRNLRKPQQDWYKCRALAESVKTTTWRYAMRSAPFDSPDDREARNAFRDHLKEILESNRHIGHRIAGLNADQPQITADMTSVRAMSLEDRKKYYTENRIKDQRKWYAEKSEANRIADRNWTAICIAVYVIAIGLVIARIVYPNILIWPIGPLIFLASAIIGWMQIKKFGELSSSYALTAHEIGLTEDQIRNSAEEKEFSTCVNEAELAFSREHTQWVARQNK